MSSPFSNVLLWHFHQAHVSLSPVASWEKASHLLNPINPFHVFSVHSLFKLSKKYLPQSLFCWVVHCKTGKQRLSIGLAIQFNPIEPQAINGPPTIPPKSLVLLNYLKWTKLKVDNIFILTGLVSFMIFAIWHFAFQGLTFANLCENIFFKISPNFKRNSAKWINDYLMFVSKLDRVNCADSASFILKLMSL